MKKTQFVALFGVVAFGGAALLGPSAAFAYEDGQPDPNTQPQEVKKQDSATIPAEGTFKEFDPTDPTDPTQPDPDPTDPAWVDVKIPTKILFGQTDVSTGIIFPLYEIENLSSKGVKISVNAFKDSGTPGGSGSQTDAEKISDKLTLNLTNKTANKDIALHTTDPQNPAQFPAEIGTLNPTGDKLEFKLSGGVATGFNFEKNALNPQYDLVLKFEVQ
ncbi:hypothetical protein [Enterococcus durans]|uniref:hypothetical protein n=1 Tax=Enterococcus durans TaxID=53345 RepID=UPI000E5D8EFA|nr:hypothetical protein [Enterococcus durans]MCB8506669.1 hypothetical protein [Enterococcus durans]MCB8516749.1 hypothetical protein [Enterococcus durans]RGW62195.1 hypothetical protein DWV63_13270 [Enterococcus durans]